MKRKQIKSIEPEIKFWQDVNGHWHTENETPETITLRMNLQQFKDAVIATNGDTAKLQAVYKIGMDTGDNLVLNHIMDCMTRPVSGATIN